MFYSFGRVSPVDQTWNTLENNTINQSWIKIIKTILKSSKNTKLCKAIFNCKGTKNIPAIRKYCFVISLQYEKCKKRVCSEFYFSNSRVVDRMISSNVRQISAITTVITSDDERRIFKARSLSNPCDCSTQSARTRVPLPSLVFHNRILALAPAVVRIWSAV